MYVILLQCTHCVKKTLTVSRTPLCEFGDRVKVDQSSFSADLHAVMLRHHCSEYEVIIQWNSLKPQNMSSTVFSLNCHAKIQRNLLNIL